MDSQENYLNTPKGLWSWVTTTDHKRIFLLYLYTICLFFIVGGLFALAIRTELFHFGGAAGHVMTAQTYNRAYTLHGAIMIFCLLCPAFLRLWEIF